MIDILDRAEQQLQMAHKILTQLQLLERWQVFGTPILAGAVAYGLVIAPDIDIEIHCDVPRIEDGFAILRECAMHPNVRKARFGNYLDMKDNGLFWRLVYRTDEGTDWKIDMWSLYREHSGPCAVQLIEPLLQALTPETRRAILELKAQMHDGSVPRRPSIDVYRAVIDGGVRTSTQLEAWLELHSRPFLTFWKPGEVDPEV